MYENRATKTIVTNVLNRQLTKCLTRKSPIIKAAMQIK